MSSDESGGLGAVMTEAAATGLGGPAPKRDRGPGPGGAETGRRPTGISGMVTSKCVCRMLEEVIHRRALLFQR